MRRHEYGRGGTRRGGIYSLPKWILIFGGGQDSSPPEMAFGVAKSVMVSQKVVTPVQTGVQRNLYLRKSRFSGSLRVHQSLGI